MSKDDRGKGPAWAQFEAFIAWPGLLMKGMWVVKWSIKFDDDTDDDGDDDDDGDHDDDNDKIGS